MRTTLLVVSLLAAAQAHSAATLPAGTALRVRLGQTIDTSRNRPGDHFVATLASPITERGTVIVPRGATVTGHVTTAQPSGRLRGRAHLVLTLDTIQHNGRTYRLATSHVGRVSGAHKKRNLALIGGGSGTGAMIGAIAGGGAGALIGAGAGAAAGTVGAVVTGKKQVRLPAETLLTFRLREPAQI